VDWRANKNITKNPFIHSQYDSSHLQAYTILTICRILYRAVFDSVVSKRKAAEWVVKTYKKWDDSIKSSKNWKYGTTLERQEKTKEFIKFVVYTSK